MNLTVSGSVAVYWNLKGKSLATTESYSVDAVDYFQVIHDASGRPKIARLSRFFDTWSVTLAITGGQKYPQFSNYKP